VPGSFSSYEKRFPISPLPGSSFVIAMPSTGSKSPPPLVDLSHFLGEQLQNPILEHDKELRLWCLIAKGHTDIGIDYRATKRDWFKPQELANDLGENQWVTRASGELGLAAFLRDSSYPNAPHDFAG
jgi:hypothetical protein